MSLSGVWLSAAVAATVALLSAAPRLALAAGSLPPAAHPFIWSDLLESYEQLLQGGRIPYWGTIFYYPPLVGYLAGAFVLATRDALGYLLLWTVLTSAAAGVVAMMLARAGGARETLVCWSAAPQLLLHAGGNFDVLPTALLVASVLLLRGRRDVEAFAALGIGTLIKVFPAVAVPLELDRLRRQPRRIATALITFGGVILLVALPSLLAPWPSTASLPDYAARTNFDSVWGLLEGMAPSPAWSAFIAAITTVGLLATYAAAFLAARRHGAEPAIGAGLAVVTVLLWTRLYSPQYSVWVLPFYVLAAIPRRWFAILALADVGVFASVYPLTLVQWGPASALESALFGILGASVALRHVALVGTWISLRRLALRPATTP